MMRSEKFFAVRIGGFLLVLAVGLNGYAYAMGGETHLFGGLLFNPLDGNTYLAKAYQGWLGEWKFHLPYTVDRGNGAYINLFYVWIGHLARWIGLSIISTYNLVRIVASGLFLAAIWNFYKTNLEPGARRPAYVIAVLTLGSGWLLIPFGIVTSDFWVAEMYPLLSVLTNPHFPAALAIVFFLASPRNEDWQTNRWIWLRDAGLAFVLALISPFAVVIALLPWISSLLWDLYDQYKQKKYALTSVLNGDYFSRLILILVGGVPVLVYDYLAIQRDPILASWNALNITLTPPWWDVLLSMSPAFFLGVYGLKKAPRMLIGWLALGLVLVFIPISLQRRFLMGLYIPLAGLAGVGYRELVQGKRRIWSRIVILLFIPGPVFLLLTARYGIETRSATLYLSHAEVAAFSWIQNNLNRDDLVLTSAELGLYLPAYTGRRVVYGHPFETVDAETQEAAVTHFYREMTAEEARLFLPARDVNYVFYGPRERAIGILPDTDVLENVYSGVGVEIYKVVP